MAQENNNTECPHSLQENVATLWWDSLIFNSIILGAVHQLLHSPAERPCQVYTAAWCQGHTLGTSACRRPVLRSCVTAALQLQSWCPDSNRPSWCKNNRKLSNCYFHSMTFTSLWSSCNDTMCTKETGPWYILLCLAENRLLGCCRGKAALHPTGLRSTGGWGRSDLRRCSSA